MAEPVKLHSFWVGTGVAAATLAITGLLALIESYQLAPHWRDDLVDAEDSCRAASNAFSYCATSLNDFREGMFQLRAAIAFAVAAPWFLLLLATAYLLYIKFKMRASVSVGAKRAGWVALLSAMTFQIIGIGLAYSAVSSVRLARNHIDTLEQEMAYSQHLQHIQDDAHTNASYTMLGFLAQFCATLIWWFSTSTVSAWTREIFTVPPPYDTGIETGRRIV